jgi:hypothetical protein
MILLINQRKRCESKRYFNIHLTALREITCETRYTNEISTINRKEYHRVKLPYME